ncbi:MAG: helix-turn-helix domain-containing protein [Clostridiales bacterium]|jgi:AraC family transcriptional regulator|nr:helix-turn-helix domain-containing protein [Clostridiales bacterium]
MKPYNLLFSLLEQIEIGYGQSKIKEMALQMHISDVHLQRVFKFIFGMPIASYIRSRRLALSVEQLLNTDLRIVDIAQNADFEYERTYIRAFKREFGISPGKYRESGGIIKIVPPFSLCDKNKLDEGLIYGPEIVMVPEFYVIGRLYKIKFGDAETPNSVGRKFENEMREIPGAVNPGVYTGLTRITEASRAENGTMYLPSVQVKNIKNIPEGFTGDRFPASLCARFRYVGEHHYRDINWCRAKKMYSAINEFTDNLKEYHSLRNELFFERIDINEYDGFFCKMEWFTPLVKI